MLQGLNQTQPSFFQGKSPLNAPIVPLPSHRGATSKSTCQHIQGRGISVVTSATICAFKLMISRNMYCSILERIPLPAISAASLAGGQADWNITCFPTLVRNLLLARNAKNSCRQSHDLKTHMKTHFYSKMLITFEPNVAQRSVASQNDHKSKACLPEASNTAFTMYRRLYRAPFFLAPHS